MSRLEGRFATLREDGRTALVTFITAGDPSADVTLAAMHSMVGAGADVVELGVPFSDPMADGPVIQRASERALAAGMTLEGVLDIVRRFREDDADTPLVLMGYLNPFEARGYRELARAVADAGADGLITVDLPPEEAEDFLPALRECGLDPIFLLSPTTDEARARRICSEASGFLYYVALKGVTGSAALDDVEVAGRVSSLKALTSLPVGVGFGISDGPSAAAIGKHGDAVIVGSALVSRMEARRDEPDRIAPALAEFVGELREALDAR